MFRLFFSVLFSLVLLTGLESQGARILVVSDIDDTIKLSHVRNSVSALIRSRDSNSRFQGMSELYNSLHRDLSTSTEPVKWAYVTAAPQRLMENVHRRLLANGKFPNGEYLPRKEYDKEHHKLFTIRKLLQKEKPQVVLLFGDNGERDSVVYEQIAREFQSQGMQFHIFVRILYPFNEELNSAERERSTQAWNPPAVAVNPGLPQRQRGFVTPIEIAIELNNRRLLKSPSLDELIRDLVPKILAEPNNLKFGVLAFPSFVDCRDFHWSANTADFFPHRAVMVDALKKKIETRCSIPGDRADLNPGRH